MWYYTNTFQTYLFDQDMGVLLIQVREDLGVMAMNG